MNNKSEVLVIGHLNPDTDSIISAIAYAAFKNSLYIDDFIACRAGDINPETAWVLDRFGLEEPLLVEDVSPQIEDIRIQRIAPIDSNSTMMETWRRMRDDNITTLPVLTPDGKLEGLIGIKDLAAASMDNLNNATLSKARTPYRDMARTIDGEILCGDPNGVMEKGFIRVGAGSVETIEEVVNDGDLLILANRPNAQKAAIEAGAACIVVCLGTEVEPEILALAENHDCVVITTPLETYKAAYMISQSIPIDYYMTRNGITVFHESDTIEEAKLKMADSSYLYYPVLDDNDCYIGMISCRSLIKHDRKRVILLDHNELAQCVKGVEKANIREIIDHHRVGGLQTMKPIYFRNHPIGSTCTIVYQMFTERHVEIPADIAGAMVCAILSDTEMLTSMTTTGIDRIAVEKLSEIAGIDYQKIGEEMSKIS